MSKTNKIKQLPTQGEIFASTRRLDALRSGQQFSNKYRAAKADKTGRKSKYQERD